MRYLCVYCGTGAGRDSSYGSAARALGRELAKRQVGLVYGGAKLGLMGELASACLKANGKVVGILPEALFDPSSLQPNLSELVVVATMHERKQQMADRADAFAALPGGIGTLEELFEIWTWAQIGIHSKPIGVLNVSNYYTPLLGFLERAQREEFLQPRVRDKLAVEENPALLLDLLLP